MGYLTLTLCAGAGVHEDLRFLVRPDAVVPFDKPLGDDPAEGGYYNEEWSLWKRGTRSVVWSGGKYFYVKETFDDIKTLFWVASR
jgi:hypothetical protein